MPTGNERGSFYSHLLWAWGLLLTVRSPTPVLLEGFTGFVPIDTCRYKHAEKVPSVSQPNSLESAASKYRCFLNYWDICHGSSPTGKSPLIIYLPSSPIHLLFFRTWSSLHLQLQSIWFPFRLMAQHAFQDQEQEGGRNSRQQKR